MDFFRNQWVPASSLQPEFQFKTPVDVATTRRPAPRVVQIPVHFVGSEARRSGSALKIQKVFRGFLVRNSMKKIMEIKREVDAVEARVSQSEVADLIKNDKKERLKVNETLMSLLFKLDAVSGGGVDSGIRTCRKAVIRKAIALQEGVDSIANDQIEEKDHVDLEKALIETGCSAENACDDESSSNTCDNGEDEEGLKCVGQNVAEKCEKDEEMKRDEESCVEGDDHVSPGADDMLQGDSSLMEEVKEEEMTGHDIVYNGSEVEEEGRDDVTWRMRGGKEENEDNGDKKKKKEEEKEEVLERMVEENGKLMKMMSELLERNEAQSRMLNTLTLRLEQLEKAFVCDKMKRKKKRHCSS